MIAVTNAIISDKSLSAAVGVALAAVAAEPRDVGAVALARRYARLIDDAAPAAKYRQHLAAVREALVAGEAIDHFYKIADALSAHSVMSDLGPKLLAALVQLGMTPAARGTVAKGGGQDGGTSAVAKIESEFERARRRARERAG